MSNKKNKYKNEIKDNRFTLLFIIPVIILLGFMIRFLPYSNVMTDNMVQLKGADAYFFTRQAELITETGGLPEIDPGLCYPDGYENQKEGSLYMYLLSFTSRFVDLDTATAYLSPILALLVSVVMVFILLEIFKKEEKAIITGTTVVALTGVQYIARSYFGFGDRHVLEVFLLALGLLFLIKAWNKLSIKWAIVAGIVFAFYQLTWSQTSLLILLLTLSISFYYIKEQSVDKRFTLVTLIFLVLQLPSGIWASYNQSIGIIMCSIFLILFLHFINHKIAKVSHRVMVLVALLFLMYLVLNTFFKEFLDKLIYIIWGFIGQRSEGPVVSEAQPMYVIYEGISFLPPNAVFFQVFLFIMAIVGLFNMLKSRHYIIAIFGLFMALLSVHRIRSEYYFVIFASISLAYLVIKNSEIYKYILIAVIGFVLTYSVAWNSDLQAQRSSLAFSNADYQMAEWMRENVEGDDYGILADWQLGYLYTYLADKPMLAEPNFCNYLKPTEFFLLQDEATAYEMAKGLGIKYVIVKRIDINKYYYHLNQLDKMDEFKVKQVKYNDVDTIFYDQSYFQRMFARMYNFNGLGTEPDSVFTISSENEVNVYDSFDSALATGAGVYYSPATQYSSVPLSSLKHFKLIKMFTDDQGGVKLYEVVD